VTFDSVFTSFGSLAPTLRTPGSAAGYLSTLLDGGDPAGCLVTGALAGAYTVTVPGDWEGLPFPADLELLQAADGVVR